MYMCTHECATSDATLGEEDAVGSLPHGVWGGHVCAVLQPAHLQLADDGAPPAVLVREGHLLLGEQAAPGVRVHELDLRIALPEACVRVAVHAPVVAAIAVAFLGVAVAGDLEPMGDGRRVPMRVEVLLRVVVHQADHAAALDRGALRANRLSSRRCNSPQAIGIVRTFHGSYGLLTATRSPVDIMRVEVVSSPVFKFECAAACN
mmetsp:Transcript_8942/g.17500  ORF Transcript_8942/g.17500 Transcript_8942/m.17500 type:complete len:205 (+) Transcript_8942:45-659(+)